MRDTGVDAVDGFCQGVPVATVGNYTIYRLPKAGYTESRVPSASWPDILELLSEQPPGRRSRFIFMLYAAKLNLETVYNVLKERTSKKKCLMNIGHLANNDTVALVRKDDDTGLPDLSLVGVGCRMFSLTRGHVSSIQRFLVLLSTSITVSYTDMGIVPERSEEVSFEQIVASASHLSTEDLCTLRGTIEARPLKKRTQSDLAILRCYGSLLAVRKQRVQCDNSILWSPSSPMTPLVPFKFLTGLDQIGTRLVEQSNGLVAEYTLRQLFEDWNLMRQFSVVLLGSDHSTGFGKSSLARKLCAHWSLESAKVFGLAPGDMRVATSTTIEELKTTTFSRGWSVMLDEFCLSDEQSLQYFSETMAKCLFDPSLAASLRCRERNARLVPDTARVMTSNATSLEAWAGSRLHFSLPLKRKIIAFIIKEPLVPVAWSSRPDYVPGEL
jgi:hypothetical protein